MTPKQFQKYLDRDGGCWHCGEQEAVAPQHRVNRGMGGSKSRDVPSNVIVLCSALNGLVEASSTASRTAKSFGWKLESWQNPKEFPVWDARTQQWFYLDDSFSRIVVPPAISKDF